MIKCSDSSDGILTRIRPIFTAKNLEGWIKYEPPQKNLLENPGDLSRVQETKILGEEK